MHGTDDEAARVRFWALVRILLGSMQMAGAFIGAVFLVATGVSALSLGMALFAITCTVVSKVLFWNTDAKVRRDDAGDGGAL